MRKGNVFSRVCLFTGEEESHVTIVYDVFNLAIQGLLHRPHCTVTPPPQHGTSLCRDLLPPALPPPQIWEKKSPLNLLNLTPLGSPATRTYSNLFIMNHENLASKRFSSYWIASLFNLWKNRYLLSAVICIPHDNVLIYIFLKLRLLHLEVVWTRFLKKSVNDLTLLGSGLSGNRLAQTRKQSGAGLPCITSGSLPLSTCSGKKNLLHVTIQIHFISR